MASVDMSRPRRVPPSLLLLLLAMPVVLTQSASSTDPDWRCSCPPGFVTCGGRCYTRLDRCVDYAQAERDCAAIGAHLAVPRSREQNLCVAGLAGLRRAWIGVTDREHEGVFRGADGRPITSADGHSWAPGQPDNHKGREDCVHVVDNLRRGYRFADWNDDQCSKQMYPLCQLPV